MAAFVESSSTSRLNEPADYTVISTNVGGSGDLTNLWLQNPGLIIDKRLTSIINQYLNLKPPQDQTKEDRDEESNLREIIREYASEAYKSIAKTAFRYIIANHQPDIICLQEFNSRVPDHQEIKELLEEEGYEVTKGRDGNVAFKKDRFSLLNQKETKGDALYVTLMDTTNKKVVRVVSDHVRGFNGVLQKEQTALSRDQAATGEQRSSARNYKIMRTKEGNDNLKDTIQDLKNDEIQPSLVIYAADLNSTAKYVSDEKRDRLNPKRFDLLEQDGFIFDTTDKEPTIEDPNFKRALKYDYIVVKSLQKGIKATITSKALDQAGSLELRLNDYRTYPSDHRPVKAQIRLEEDKFCNIQ